MGRARIGHRRGVPGGEDVNTMAGGATGLPVIGSEADVLRLGKRLLAPVLPKDLRPVLCAGPAVRILYVI